MGRRPAPLLPYEISGKKWKKDRPESALLNAMAWSTPPNAFDKHGGPEFPGGTWLPGYGRKLYGGKDGDSDHRQGFCPVTETHSNVTLESGQHSWRYTKPGEAGRGVICNVRCLHCYALRQIHDYFPAGFTDDGRLIEVCVRDESWEKHEESCGHMRIGRVSSVVEPSLA